MIKLQFKDGSTLPINLNDEREAERWINAFGDSSFQRSICGAVILSKHTARGKRAGERVVVPFSVQGNIPKPDAFGNVWYEAEIVEHKGRAIGERIVVFADDVRLTVTSYHSQAASRIELSKMGKRRIRT